MKIQKVSQIEDLKIEDMISESLAEGYNFVDKLMNEYKNGKNKFDKINECLFTVIDASGKIIAVGGIIEDIYENNPDIGRVKHVYVLKENRKQKVGTLLLECLIDFSKDHYNSLHLRTPNNNKLAGLFYESLGFERCDESNYSHRLFL